MKEKFVDSMSEGTLAPADFISLMFERTDEDGILYIPGWHYDGPGWMENAPGSTDEYDSYRCHVDWNLKKYERLLDKFDKHYATIEKIAALEKDAEQAGTPFELNGELYEFWNTYLEAFDIGDIDYERIRDIDDRLDTIEWVKTIAANIAKGGCVQDFEKGVISEYIDVDVTDEELQYRDEYIENVIKDAEKRVGDNICAYEVTIRSKRLYRLMQLGAPQVILNGEARQLAAAMLLHDYGVSKEVVDNNIRLRLERLEMMSDEELDELYRPKKANSRKSLAPLFVYEILSKKSDSKKHLRQSDILIELEKYPYEITIERKALGRIIHNLADSGYGIYTDKTGVWKE